MATHRFSLRASPCSGHPVNQGEHCWSWRLHLAGPIGPSGWGCRAPLPGRADPGGGCGSWALCPFVYLHRRVHLALGFLTCVLQCSTEASCPRDQVYKPCGEAKRNTCFSRWVISYKAFIKSIMWRLPGKFEVHIPLRFRCHDCPGQFLFILIYILFVQRSRYEHPSFPK